ncbi:protein dead ringer isoform X2 [Wyeomyia smithii]|uniref:protein dead ringer isoform X2 n=1 Tax=Wyeomyia smithii TaxID=174621 RepID=UPI002467BDD0|nr:protein dead ringer isoform X2 [Wyeomyia smithii]
MPAYAVSPMEHCEARLDGSFEQDHGCDSSLLSPESSHQDDGRSNQTGESDDGEEGGNIKQPTTAQQDANKMTSGMEFGRSPDHHSELSSTHPSQFGQTHPLGVLGNLSALNMNVPNLSGLSGLSGLQHGDVLEKLKMQVRDMKVGLLGDQSDFAASLHASFGASALQHHHQQQLQQQSPQAAGSGSIFGSVDSRSAGLNSNGTGTGSSGSANAANSSSYSFTLPNPPINKDANPGSNSSTSSETSNSSQQNNGWSFEEQFKQVRQLYEINDDPKRKEFLDDLFLFMQKRGTPINRLPIMAKSVLDLYELYNLVIARGGLVDVINKKLWQEIIKGLHLPSSITSAAFTLRTQYMKYLYPYECEKKNLSTPAELQAAIDGNRREGRRSSYGQFDSPSVQRSPIPQSIQQMSPLSLVTHVNQQQHHRLLGAPNVGQMPNILPADFEQRMIDYIKLFQPKEMKREQSPDQMTPRDALNALEMSRVALWNMYNNNTSPPNSLNTSPPEMQREALNLAESPPHHMSVKRERDHPMDFTDRSGAGRDYHSGIPPAKRSNNNSIAAVAAVAQLQQQQQQQHHQQQQQLHGHNRSLTPQKLNLSSHDEDDARSLDETPINLRGENGGLRHHDDDMPDEEEEDEDEEMSMGDDVSHPLALNRITEHAAALAAAAQREREQVQVNHLASLNLSLLERERERCDSADKLKRQQLEQLQREQLLHHQQQQQQQLLQRERERERDLQRERERELQKQQQLQIQQQEQSGSRQNGDRLCGTGMDGVSNNTSTSSEHQQHRSGSAHDAYSPNRTASAPVGTTTGGGGGIMGMQFKLISRGDASKGDQQLVVSMEFNGVQYEGVLFANPSSSPNSSSSLAAAVTGHDSRSSTAGTDRGNKLGSNPASSPLLVTAVTGAMSSSVSPVGSINSTSSTSVASPTGSLLVSPAKTATSSIGCDEPIGHPPPPPVIASRPLVS